MALDDSEAAVYEKKKKKNTLIHYYGSHGARTEILGESLGRTRAVIRRRTQPRGARVHIMLICLLISRHHRCVFSFRSAGVQSERREFRRVMGVGVTIGTRGCEKDGNEGRYLSREKSQQRCFSGFCVPVAERFRHRRRGLQRAKSAIGGKQLGIAT